MVRGFAAVCGLRGLRGRQLKCAFSDTYPKIIEGRIKGRDYSSKLLCNLDLGGLCDLCSDLRGRPRPDFETLRF